MMALPNHAPLPTPPQLFRLEVERLGARVSVEHGSARRGAAMREDFQMERNWYGELVVKGREVPG